MFKTVVFAAAFAASAFAASASDLAAPVATYAPGAGFNLTIAGKQLTGVFVADAGACSVTVVSQAENADYAPEMTRLSLAANSRVDLPVNADKALALGCAPAAAAIKVGEVELAPDHFAAR